MRQRRLLVQVGVAAVLIGLLALLVNNLAVNLIRTGLGLGFGWLGRPAGFALHKLFAVFRPDHEAGADCRLGAEPERKSD